MTPLLAVFTAAEQQQGSLLSLLFPLLLLAPVIYLMIVPQRKQKQRHAEFISSLKIGDDVVKGQTGATAELTVAKGDRVTVTATDSKGATSTAATSSHLRSQRKARRQVRKACQVRRYSPEGNSSAISTRRSGSRSGGTVSSARAYRGRSEPSRSASRPRRASRRSGSG